MNSAPGVQFNWFSENSSSTLLDLNTRISESRNSHVIPPPSDNEAAAELYISRSVFAEGRTAEMRENAKSGVDDSGLEKRNIIFRLILSPCPLWPGGLVGNIKCHCGQNMLIITTDNPGSYLPMNQIGMSQLTREKTHYRDPSFGTSDHLSEIWATFLN